MDQLTASWEVILIPSDSSGLEHALDAFDFFDDFFEMFDIDDVDDNMEIPFVVRRCFDFCVADIRACFCNRG